VNFVVLERGIICVRGTSTAVKKELRETVLYKF